ncbi:hypothetical protein E1B28_000607 [Marasmius oreades]|uniref:Uncharacterized protein n=1 Tax=Marasmius oreades TaxID=181124 RepID=A0A9P7V1Q4_9AGAR|nr:uncharacterized protein E1B28_000607 [Marasmius oreades]KAG7098694.1 hypothetical protein E1B28_000607 [Marasmius oreades]
MTRVLAAITLVAGFATVSAQNLTPGCQNALKNIAANQDAAACLTPAALVGIAATNSSTSLVGPIGNWLDSLCGVSPCSNSTLDFVVSTLTSGCSAELSLVGYTSDQQSNIEAVVRQYYPTVRKVVCLKDGNDNCITKTLKAVESVVGPLSIDNLAKIITGSSNLNSSAIPKEVYCSDCTKAQYNIINKEIPNAFDGSKSDITQQCGSSFVDGQDPSGITQSAVASPSKGNAAHMLSAFPDTSATYAFLAVAGLFAMAA